MPGVLIELEMRSVELGDMKSVIVEEMSILWSAIRSSVRKEHNSLCGKTVESVIKISTY